MIVEPQTATIRVCGLNPTKKEGESTGDLGRFRGSGEPRQSFSLDKTQYPSKSKFGEAFPINEKSLQTPPLRIGLEENNTNCLLNKIK